MTDKLLRHTKPVHGGVLVAVRNTIKHKPLPVTCKEDDVLIIQLLSTTSTVIICCLYNAPAPSAYQWTTLELNSLLNELDAMRQQSDLIITGDLNFVDTKWKLMSSSNPYEEEILERLLGMNLSKQASFQLDILLCNTTEIVIDCSTDYLLQKRLTKDKKNFSNHPPMRTEILFNCSKPLISALDKLYAFRKTGWEAFNQAILREPFEPFCYSNVDHLVHHWYKWLWMKIDTIVPRITKHRATLPPWMSSSTSHLIKRLETITAKQTQKLATILKRKKLEGRVAKAMENDLIEFEKSVFEDRVFSRLQRYLKSIRKSPEIPPVVKNGSKESVSETEQCNMFNDYFISVFNKQTLEMPSTTPPLNRLNQIRVTPETVSKLLASLKEDKAMGNDKIGNLILKQCSHTLCISLAMIFQT